MLIHCTTCKKEFNKKPSRITISNYCSKECKKEGRLTGINTECHICSKKIYIQKSKSNNSKSGFNFCSRSCATSYNNTLKVSVSHPNFTDGASCYHYRKLAFNAYDSKCNRCGYDEHIGVLQVHHIDHDRTNNELFNLEILCPTCHQVEHVIIHGGTQNKP